MIDVSLMVQIILAVLVAVVLYTFIGFIPGTDETSVLMPVTLALVLSGAAPMVVLAFFIASIVTLNLSNTMPTTLVGLPGGVMSSPMIEHAITLKNQGKSAMIIKKMAAASVIGVVVSLITSLVIAALLAPYGQLIQPYAPYLFVFGAIFLSLISKHKLLSLLSIVPLAVLFMSLRHLYWGLNVVDAGVNITTSFFLGITIGPLLVSLIELLNKDKLKAKEKDTTNTIIIPKQSKDSLSPFKLLSKKEAITAGISAFFANFLFVLSPVGLTILFGETVAKQEKDPEKKATLSITTMSAMVQSTYLSQVIIPLIALGIPLSPVAIGPAAALFNATGVYSLENNIHHMLSFSQFAIVLVVSSVIALSLVYVLIHRYASILTRLILSKIPHESVLGLFVALILLLAYMDAGLINIFGVLLIGLIGGTFHKLGVNYGVQFMSLYASSFIVSFLVGGLS
jgi:putative tricarboxylic transport membrane protein